MEDSGAAKQSLEAASIADPQMADKSNEEAPAQGEDDGVGNSISQESHRDGDAHTTTNFPSKSSQDFDKVILPFLPSFLPVSM